MKQRILTGTRPSGSPHLGNYFGAYKPAVDLQQGGCELYFFLADYHALNSNFSAEQLKMQSLDMVATMLAAGLDPDKSQFYSQSLVPQVCELGWILGCSTPYPLMLRAHSFKDAQAKGNEVNMGVFNYPVLMTADILLFEPDLVPVGKDQKQHLEMARDIATRFNQNYGEIFKLPEPMISETVAIVPGTDGEKMSKSKGNIIPLFATDATWKKACMSIVSDSKGLEDKKDPDTCNIFALYKLVETNAENIASVADKYRNGGFGYGHAKLALLDAIKSRFSQSRDTYFELMKKPDYLQDVLRSGAKKVATKAQKKMEQVKAAIGVLT